MLRYTVRWLLQLVLVLFVLSLLLFLWLRSLPGDSRLLGHYGACLAVLGDKDKARETLDAALAADPNNAEALATLAGLDA